MYLRQVVPSDIEIVKNNLDKFKFPVPKIEDCIIRSSVVEGDKLLGIGYIKPVGEVTILLMEGSEFKKTKAIKLLFDEAIIQSSKNNINQWYAFIDDDNWVNQVIKHYGFKPIERAGFSLEL